MRKRVVFEARNGAQGARTSSEVCGGAREQGERGGTGRAGDGGRSLRGSSATAVLKLVRGNLDGEDAPGSPCRRDPWGNQGGITSKTQPRTTIAFHRRRWSSGRWNNIQGQEFVPDFSQQTHGAGRRWPISTSGRLRGGRAR